jgi:hypothetical protein
MLSVLLTIALTATTPAAVAAATPAPQAASVTATAPAEEKKICRRIEASESRLGAKRVCKTAADWKLDQEGSQRGKKD